MRYKIITGKDLSQDKYLKTWELDNRTFGDEDKLTKKQALAWFEFSGRSTIVLWDTEEDKLIGYITPFLLKHTFACDYIISSSAHYKKSITEECFVEPGEGVAADIYIFSTVVEEEYRDVCLQEDDKNSPFYKKTAFKVLNEAFIDWVCDIKEKGVSVNYVFAEMVSKDGEKYLKSLGMQKCSAIGNDYKYARLFSVDMFKKCSNINKLYDLYQKENVRKPFDNNLLANHEYLSIKENVLYYKDINLLDLIWML